MSKGKRIGIGLVLALLSLVVALGCTMLSAQWFENRKRFDAELVLSLAQRNIEEMLVMSQNEAMLVTEYLGNATADVERFEEAAQRFVEKDGVSQVFLVENTTVVGVVSKDGRTEEIGLDLSQFPYVVNMARLLKQTVVEGPVTLFGKTQCFLFIEPILQGTDCVGEVIVVADAAYVMEQLNLEYLGEKGYHYELWRIDSQDGEKAVVAISDDAWDTSNAIRSSFYLPNEWTLEIEPVGGWVTPNHWIISVTVGGLAGLLFFAICYILLDKQDKRIRERHRHETDAETGMMSVYGFERALDRRVSRGLKNYTLILVVMDEYAPLARVLSEEQRKAYLEHVVDTLNGHEEIPHIACRISEGSYAVAILEKIAPTDEKTIAKEMALELLWKTTVEGKRAFIHARWSIVRCPADGDEVLPLVKEGLKRFDKQYYPREEED